MASVRSALGLPVPLDSGHGVAAAVYFPQSGLGPSPRVGVRPWGGETLEAMGTMPGLQETFLQQATPCLSVRQS